jgi:Flp pilus assembly protein TadG
MKEEHENPKEQGQSLVELAISLVVLLTLLAGVMDFGRAFFTFVALRDAAQEGAAYASVAAVDPIGNCHSSFCQVSQYCQAIEDRILITTSDLSGGSVSSGPINLQALEAAGQISVQTLINGSECNNVSAADICMGGAVSVNVTYDSFPLTTPFLGALIGRQSLTIDASVNESILTPACQ